MRPGCLQATVAPGRANLEGSVNSQQDELRAKGGCQGHDEALPSALPISPQPLPPQLCLLFIFLAGWVKGQTTGRGKPQSVPGGVKWESPQTTCTAGRAISVPARVVFNGAVKNQILHLPAGQIAECILDQHYSRKHQRPAFSS